MELGNWQIKDGTRWHTAASFEEIGEIEETLKWVEPSYLTPKSKRGSTIRVAWKESFNKNLTKTISPASKTRLRILVRFLRQMDNYPDT